MCCRNRTRWAAVQIPPFPLWALLAFYALVGLYYWRQEAGRVPRVPAS